MVGCGEYFEAKYLRWVTVQTHRMCSTGIDGYCGGGKDMPVAESSFESSFDKERCIRYCLDCIKREGLIW